MKSKVPQMPYVKTLFCMLAVIITTSVFSQNQSDPTFLDLGKLLTEKVERSTCLDTEELDTNFCKAKDVSCSFERVIYGKKEVKLKLKLPKHIEDLITSKKGTLRLAVKDNLTDELKKDQITGSWSPTYGAVPVAAKFLILLTIPTENTFSELISSTVPENGEISLPRAEAKFHEVIFRKKSGVSYQIGLNGNNLFTSPYSEIFKLITQEEKITLKIEMYNSYANIPVDFSRTKSPTNIDLSKIQFYPVSAKDESNVTIQDSDLNGKTAENTFFPVTAKEYDTEVRFKTLTLKHNGSSLDGEFELKKGNISLKEKFAKLLKETNQIELTGEGICEFIQKDANGVTIPVYSTPLTGKKVGDILIYATKGGIDHSSFKSADGETSALEITGPIYKCDNQENFNIFLSVTESSGSRHNLGKGRWGENGWINAPSFKLFGHKFERQMTFEGRMYLEFRKSKLPGKILAVSFEGPGESEEIDASTLWNGNKFLPRFQCP